MEETIHLTAGQLVHGRPFTDPVHNAEDLSAIRLMASSLRPLLAQPLTDERRPLLIPVPTASGRQHRVAISNVPPLRAHRDLSFVGFFAKRRAGVDLSLLTVADDEMIQELPSFPGILSYSSLELADGNWANLIMVDPPEAKDHWRTSEKHAFAAREMAPKYYAIVRLHNGVFPGGLVSGRDPIVLRTKYYDFQDLEPWRAERVFSLA
jgi:hypothetical protein